MHYADEVVVGDGEDTLWRMIKDPGKDFENVLVEGKKSVIYGEVPNLKAFIHYTNEVGRMEVARGCKFKCTFCAVSHLKKYREVPIEKLSGEIKNSKKRRLALFAPEPTLHKEDEKNTDIARRWGRIRLDTDVRLDRIQKRLDSNAVMRCGIEGLSERLRKTIKKPYTNQKIIDVVEMIMKANRNALFLYIILDLPGETDEDWEEFREVLIKIGELPGSGDFLLKPSSNVFMPSPHTPLENAPINYAVDYDKKWREFFSPDGKRSWKVKMAERTRIFRPPARVLSMLSTRSGIEFGEIEEELTKEKILKINQGRPMVKDLAGLEKIICKHESMDRYCGQALIKPWSIVKFKHR